MTATQERALRFLMLWPGRDGNYIDPRPAGALLRRGLIEGEQYRYKLTAAGREAALALTGAKS